MKNKAKFTVINGARTLGLVRLNAAAVDPDLIAPLQVLLCAAGLDPAEEAALTIDQPQGPLLGHLAWMAPGDGIARRQQDLDYVLVCDLTTDAVQAGAVHGAAHIGRSFCHRAAAIIGSGVADAKAENVLNQVETDLRTSGFEDIDLLSVEEGLTSLIEDPARFDMIVVIGDTASIVRPMTQLAFTGGRATPALALREGGVLAAPISAIHETCGPHPHAMTLLKSILLALIAEGYASKANRLWNAALVAMEHGVYPEGTDIPDPYSKKLHMQAYFEALAIWMGDQPSRHRPAFFKTLLAPKMTRARLTSIR